MLGLEDLIVANLVVRRGVADPEALRALLRQLDQAPERVPLARALHDRLGVPLEDARAMHDGARRRMRQRSEERYLALARREPSLAAAPLDALAAEQAQQGHAGTLGERLVREGRLDPARHQALLDEAARLLAEDEARIVQQNRAGDFAQALSRAAPPAAPRGPSLTASQADARLFASTSSQDARPALAADARSTSSRRAVAPPDPRATSSRRVVAAPPAELAPGDAERTVTLPAPGAGDASDRTVLLPAGAAAGGPAPAPQGDRTVRMGAGPPLPIGPDPAASAARRGPSLTAFAGRRVGGKYEIVRELGRGNMGIVFLAAELAGGRQVALKVVQGPANADARGRFKREILVSQRLRHPHVIEVLDAGELENGSSFMVMELLDGGALTELVKREGALGVERALSLFEQLLRGLEAVHAAKVVHRDLKPDNVHVVTRDGAEHVKIMDFGISRFLDQDAAEQQEVFVTVRGTLSGTPQYVAPEAVLDPEHVATTHDVYACGVLLFEMLTGTLPFPPARTLKDILADTLNTRPRALDEANPSGAPFPPPLERFVRRLLEKDPEARPGDATRALAALDELKAELAGGGGRPKRRGRGEKAGGEAPAEGITARFLRKITSIFRRGE
ncbi:MAG: serine/threonine protein kinase [Planctomycetes bacterium]|nr:serine/threonine protein kinase [Planctomycetota bacterium]